MKLRASSTVVMLFVACCSLLALALSAHAANKEAWSATSVAWLSTGDDGKFINPRVICSPKVGFVGTAWEERHDTWSRTGVTLYENNGWLVLPLSKHRRIHGLAACSDKTGAPVLAHGSPDGVFVWTFHENSASLESLLTTEGKVFDILPATGGSLTVLYEAIAHGEHHLHVARLTHSGWKNSTIDFGGVKPSSIHAARLARGPDGRLACVALRGDETCITYRAHPVAGGWTASPVPKCAWNIEPRGRMGLAYDRAGHLNLAYMEHQTAALRMIDLDDAPSQTFEPQPGTTLRWPQVDLSFDKFGTAHVIYFAVTPDGGLQIRLARDRAENWSSLMIDRTMSKNSLASCSLGLQHDMHPFLAYALGPARAVLLAYPKEVAPPGIGL